MTKQSRGTEQANVPPRLQDLSLKFWLLVVLVGVGAGVGAMAMMGILRGVQHVAFAYHSGEFTTAVSHHSDARRVIVLLLGGLITGMGLWRLRRNKEGTGGEPTEVVWTESGRLSFTRTVISGGLSEVTVGMGASLGRESAPQRVGAALADFVGRHFSLPTHQRSILIACGAGAGLAAIYNVPLAGAVFAAELYLGTISLPFVLPALLASGVATAVSWITLRTGPAYDIPRLPHPTVSVLIFALALGPILGVLSGGYIRVIVWATDHQPKGRWLVMEPIILFGLLGLLAIQYPLLLGNGKDLAQFAYTGSGGILTYVALTILKPLATTGSLRSGATGGLFTPTLSLGAIAGALFGHLWITLWPGAPLATYAVIGSAALLAAAMQAPVTAILFVLELTQTIDAIMVPLLIAVVGATLTARHLDLRSIYSGRLPAHPDPAVALKEQASRRI